MARTYVDKNGYRRFSDSGKSVARWAAEDKIGRKLRSGEVVHHGYGGKTRNNPDNLWVFPSQLEHMRKKHRF